MSYYDMLLAKKLSGGGGGSAGGGNFVVEFDVPDLGEPSEEVTADKTFTQIKQAYENGQNLVGKCMNSSVNSDVFFALDAVEFEGGEIIGFRFNRIVIADVGDITNRSISMYEDGIFYEIFPSE